MRERRVETDDVESSAAPKQPQDVESSSPAPFQPKPLSSYIRVVCRSWACSALGWGCCCLLFWLHLVSNAGPGLKCGFAAGRCILGTGTCNLEHDCSGTVEKTKTLEMSLTEDKKLMNPPAVASVSHAGVQDNLRGPATGGGAFHITGQGDASPIVMSNAGHEATTSHPTCMDSNPDCRNWAADGECTRNPQYMLDSCACACGKTHQNHSQEASQSKEQSAYFIEVQTGSDSCSDGTGVHSENHCQTAATSLHLPYLGILDEITAPRGCVYSESEREGVHFNTNEAGVAASNFQPVCQKEPHLKEEETPSTQEESLSKSLDEALTSLPAKGDHIKPNFLELVEGCKRPAANTAACLVNAQRWTESLGEAASLPKQACQGSESISFHTWLSNPPGRTAGLMFKAFRATQAPCADLHVWVYTKDKEAMEQKLENEKNSVVKAVNEMKGSGVSFEAITDDEILQWAHENEAFQALAEQYQSQGVPPSQIFTRLLLLELHGGIFLDQDMMPMQEFGAIFSGVNFAYEWSTSGAINVGAMGIKPGSGLAGCIVRQAETLDDLKPNKFKKRLKSFASQCQSEGFEELVVMPCALFDPLWLYADRIDNSVAAPWSATQTDVFSQFFFPADASHAPNEKAIASFLKSGPFVYHMHRSDQSVIKAIGKSKYEPKEGSWFMALEKHFVAASAMQSV